MEAMRAENEDAVAAALRRERAARELLERTVAREDADDVLVRECRRRWQEASRSLVGALEALKRR